MVEDRSTKTLKQLSIIGIILAIIGLGISFYSIQHHLEVMAHGQSDAFCNINQTFSCDSIASSAFSEDPYGNPLGVYGAGYFLGLILLLGVALKKAEYRRDALHAYSLLVGIGVVISVVLGIISYFVVGSICLTCIGIYLVCFVQGAVLIFSKDAIPGGWSLKSITNGSSYAVVALFVAIFAFQIFKPASSSPEFTADEARSPGDMARIMEQIESRQKELARNQSILTVDRSPYSGAGEDYRKGPDNARVTIIEFADFQCPACAQASRLLDQLYQEFQDQIQIVYKNFPLNSNCNPAVSREVFPHTCEAAVMARCAGRHGKFWEMHDKIFNNQPRIDSQRLELWALEIGLSQSQVDECRDSQDILEKIASDTNQANQLGLTGTPTIYMNGVKVEARSLDHLRSTVQSFLYQ